MRLISCHIENFGKLNNLTLSFSSGLHSVCEKNGWGKSTLCTFLKVMFYGFENERSRDEFVNERRRYRPWQGGIYGGSLTFEVRGIRYVVTRTFGQKEKEDTFSLREEMTNLVSKDYSKELGEELFHIDRNSFERTLCVSQNDCETETTDRIHAKIGNLTEAADDISDYQKADSRLHDILNSMSPVRKTGSLYRMEEEMCRLETEVRRKDVLRRELSAYENELTRIKEEEEALGKERCAALERKKRQECKEDMPRRTDLTNMLQECILLAAEENTKDIHKLTLEEERQYSEWKEIIDNNEQKNDSPTLSMDKERSLLGKLSLFLYLLGSFFILLSCLLIYKGKIAGIVLLAAGIGGILAGFYYHGKNKRQKGSFSRDKSQILNGFERLNKKRECYEEAFRVCQKRREGICDYIRRFGTETEENLQKQILSMMEQVEEHEDALMELEWKLRQLENRLELCRQKQLNVCQRMEKQMKLLEELSEKEADLQELKERYSQDFLKYERLRAAKDYLGKAKEAFMCKYKNPLMEAFAYYYEMLADEPSIDCCMDANLALTRMEAGNQRETRYYSTGWKDLLGICMRMAFVEAMYKEEKPFLIFDDPFVNLDQDKTEAGLTFLKKIAGEYQVIYFTCHDSRAF